MELELFLRVPTRYIIYLFFLISVFLYGWSTYARRSYMAPLAARKLYTSITLAVLFYGFYLGRHEPERLFVEFSAVMFLMWAIYYTGYFLSFCFIRLRRAIIKRFLGIEEFRDPGFQSSAPSVKQMPEGVRQRIETRLLNKMRKELNSSNSNASNFFLN